MITRLQMAAVLLTSIVAAMAMADEPAAKSDPYKALVLPAPMLGSTWAILDRDGAHRQVEPYLSSLGQGESGTGAVLSPSFAIAGDTITFTLCGHDGRGGGGGENYIALVDAQSGATLMKTAAPGKDAMQERSWDVSKFQGKEVRIEVHDGNSGGAFAWLGVGRIDARPALDVDFRQGLPDDWQRSQREAGVRYETLRGGVPFRRNAAVFTVIPNSSEVEIPCGFAAERLFFLGGTVSGAAPLDTCGRIEIHYRSGPPDVFPLMVGFTLDNRYKLLSPSKAIYLHPSADPYQPYFALGPRSEVIETIRLTANPGEAPIPRITAVTCETTAESDHLVPLPDSVPGTEEAAWIGSHTISPGDPPLERITDEIRRANKMASSGR